VLNVHPKAPRRSVSMESPLHAFIGCYACCTYRTLSNQHGRCSKRWTFEAGRPGLWNRAIVGSHM